MKAKRHTPNQVIRKLREAERLLGENKTVSEVAKAVEVSEVTFHRWRNQYGGMKAADAKRLKELERENGALKRLVADKELEVRSVPMMPELIPLLDGLSRRQHFTGDEDLVFCDVVGRHLDGWALRRRFYRVLERAGLRRIRFHDLRRCFGSTAVRAFPLSDVQAMMGHAHVTTTLRYVHRPGAHDGERLSAAFRGETCLRLCSQPSRSRPTERKEDGGAKPSGVSEGSPG